MISVLDSVWGRSLFFRLKLICSGSLLLVLDDIAVVGAGDKALNEVFVNGRHFNCSVVLLSQQSNNLASTIVRNNSNVLIWGGLNGEQTDLVRKAIGLPTEVLSKREFGAWSFQNTGAPEHQFAVHFVSKKKEMPLILTKVAVDQPRLMLRGAVSNAGAGGGGGGGGGGGASLAAVAEASFSQETDVMAPTPLPYPEILQLQTLVSEQQAKIIELEGEVREGDGYAHRLVNTQDEAGPRQGAHEAAFWRATGTGCASATGGCGLLGARQGAPQGDSQGS